MSDIFSKPKRSDIMSKISDKVDIPDIVLPKYKTIIFIHGCFWHGHEGCNKSALPATNLEFWKDKLEKTKKETNPIF